MCTYMCYVLYEYFTHYHYSAADLCNNCAFDDKSIKLGTLVHHKVLQIFRCRAIGNLTFGDLYDSFSAEIWSILSLSPLGI